MAVTKREKALISGAIMLVTLVSGTLWIVMPGWQEMTDKQAKIKTLETEFNDLKQQEITVQTDISRLEKATNLPSDLVIRKFTEANLAANIKEMQDQIIGLATQSDNELISLAPASVSAAPPPPPPPTDKDKKDKPSEKAANAATPGATASSADAATSSGNSLLQVFQYDLAFRGSYDNILQFLSQLNSHKELIEITRIEIKNESGPERQGDPAANGYNPLKPIKIQLGIKLVLQADDNPAGKAPEPAAPLTPGAH